MAFECACREAAENRARELNERGAYRGLIEYRAALYPDGQRPRQRRGALPRVRVVLTMTPVCNAIVGADIVGYADTAEEALRILRAAYRTIHIPRVKLKQVLLSRAEAPRHVVAWIPDD